MKYLINVPLELATPLASDDPDVRSVSRLPGFKDLAPVAGHASRCELAFEVEGGSIRDAADAAEETLVDYLSALAAYGPRVLAAVNPAPS